MVLTFAIVAGACGSKLKEASSNFDLVDVEPFLEKVTAIVDAGFGQKERAQVVDTLKSMKVGEAKSIEFDVTYKNERSPLRVKLHLDDTTAVDTYFFAIPALADAIQAEMNKR